MSHLLWTMFAKAINSKSELKVTLATMVVAALAPKLGVPTESLNTFFMSAFGLATAYVAGRSYAKPLEKAHAVEELRVINAPVSDAYPEESKEP